MLHPTLNIGNDYIGPVGSFDFYLLSAAPQKTPKYYSFITVFDPSVWAFILASLVSVTIALIAIDNIHGRWSGASSKDTVVTGQSD